MENAIFIENTQLQSFKCTFLINNFNNYCGGEYQENKKGYNNKKVKNVQQTILLIF